MRLFTITAVTALLASGLAQAADLPSTKGAPTLEPIAAGYDWSGFYAGLHIGGAHVGYNSQFGRLVVGLQTEFNGSGATGSLTSFGITGKYEEDWFGSVDGRIGYAFDRALVYAIGGYAYSGVEARVRAAGTTLYSVNATRDGYDVGGGVEYAFTDRLSARVEYRYYDFGRESYYVPAAQSRYSARITDNVVRVGLTCKFGPNAESVIAAKY